MTPAELGALARKVSPWVQEAANLAHAHFCRRELSIETKGDGSPVTQADRETEKQLRIRLATLGNAYGIMGEEFGNEGEGRELQWVIDPIDGTRAFTRGLPYWSLLLALMHEGQPVLGFLNAPAMNVLAVGWRGGGTYVNGAACQVSSVTKLSQAFVQFGSLEVLHRQPWAPSALQIMGDCWTTRSYGDAPAYIEILRGRCDAMIEPEGNLWDFAALKILVEEAGGRFTDIQGRDTADGGSVLATNGHLHEDLLARLRTRAG